jgi:flagellar basal-body rod protein FlgB
MSCQSFQACKELPQTWQEAADSPFDTLSAGWRNPLAAKLSRSWHMLCIEPCRRTHYGFETMEFKAMAQHEQALRFRAQRNEVLSSNIANADTPNYKARDLDFAAALRSASGGGLNVQKTSALHLQPAQSAVRGGATMYRIPSQPTLDGNTVESDVEQAAFAENAVQYRASLAFLDGQIRTLRYALKGGD